MKRSNEHLNFAVYPECGVSKRRCSQARQKAENRPAATAGRFSALEKSVHLRCRITAMHYGNDTPYSSQK
jgi:hypothetical protein